uniref:Uncharacterized protein AlNc14C245G9536 n=1 Tax=Albugo laibachii Nc14 TaxID=890382 RepID=F0WT52_9STRA|nr:conserved hypothetical protein [Albugo laibachii Nc14]CCA25972.1 conserved hypothetical protein [Albugo laibachii Nc14]|eukprot:CCA25972.1 conserved hypothetical protein [Albugo laibachii Nc14]
MQPNDKERQLDASKKESMLNYATQITESTITSNAKRSRSKSEETAMILTSLSQGNCVTQDDEQLPKAKGITGTGDGCHLADRELSMRKSQDGFVQSVCIESGRSKNSLTKQISLDELRAHFDRPIIEVAKKFGICITLMKKICRRNGIKRWPHRQIRSLTKSIAALEAAMLSANETELERYQDQIMNLRRRRESVITDPNKISMAQAPWDQEYSFLKKTDCRSQAPSPIQTASSTSIGLSTGESRSNPVSPNSSKLNETAQCSPLIKRPNGASSLCNTMAEKVATLVHSAQYLDASDFSKEVSHECQKQMQSNSNQSKGGRWTSEEHAAFLVGIRCYGKDWRRVAQIVKTRNPVQTRTHAQKYLLKFSGRYANEQPQNLEAEPSIVPRSPISKAAVRDSTASGAVCCDGMEPNSMNNARMSDGAALVGDQIIVSFDPIHKANDKESIKLGSPIAAAALCVAKPSTEVPCIL